ncbi:MAG: antiactivator of flagellar biosynthesis FleN protein [Oxalobacter sp.]|nr:MAG: antiactivator of flagellar biosynthesis FleN protein [Oxalobacter sp.]
MLSGARPRVFTFISTLPREEKVAMLTNIGASLANADSSVLLLDATIGVRGTASYLDISQAVTLLHAARKEYDLEHAIRHAPQGFCMATLGRSSLQAVLRNRLQAGRLKSIFDKLINCFDVIMIDAQLSDDDDLIFPILPEGEIVIHVSDNARSIKAAYAIIKQINSREGRRSFGVLLTGASEKRTQAVYENMAKAASRYLAVSLNAIGYVPTDEYIGKAASLGKTVVDAFPKAGAAIAFRQLAGYFSCADVTSKGMGVMSH